MKLKMIREISRLSFGFHDNNIEFGTNLNSTISNVDIPLMPLSLTQLTRGYVTNDDNTNMKSSNKETDLANHINNNQYKLEDTLTGLGNNSNNNLDLVSVKEPEKIVIHHNPETDEIVVDPLPTPLLEVLQSPGSDCDRCFASESVGGTLPPPRVAELKVLLGGPR